MAHVDPYRVFFEHNLDALLLATPEGEILRANKTACEMFNCTEQDLRRGGRKGIVDPSDSRMTTALKERSRTGKIRTVDSFISMERRAKGLL
jgi:PAS domain S-box-containing protein